MNVAVSPATCQLPEIFGESVGSGEFGASADENVTVTGAPPLAPCVPPAGVTETTRSSAAGGPTTLRGSFDVPVSCLLSLALASES